MAITTEEKLLRLKRARQMLSEGYQKKIVEARVKSDMRCLRDWAKELEFQLEPRKT